MKADPASVLPILADLVSKGQATPQQEAELRRALEDREFDQRRPREHDSPYMGFIARLPCIACLVRTGRTMRPVQVAHCRANYEQEAGPFWRPVGMQEKPHDRRCTPLCVSCHLSGPLAQHASNERDWWATLGIYPPDLCAALTEAFDHGADPGAVLARFAGRAAALRAAR